MLLIETLANTVSTSHLLRDTITASLGFAASLSLREFLVAIATVVSPGTLENSVEHIVFLLFLVVFMFLLTVIVVIAWT